MSSLLPTRNLTDMSVFVPIRQTATGKLQFFFINLISTFVSKNLYAPNSIQKWVQISFNFQLPTANCSMWQNVAPSRCDAPNNSALAVFRPPGAFGSLGSK